MSLIANSPNSTAKLIALECAVAGGVNVIQVVRSGEWVGWETGNERHADEVIRRSGLAAALNSIKST